MPPSGSLNLALTARSDTPERFLMSLHCKLMINLYTPPVLYYFTITDFGVVLGVFIVKVWLWPGSIRIRKEMSFIA